MRITPLFKSSILLVLVFSGGLIGATVARGQTTISFQAGASFTTWGGDYAKEARNTGFDVGYRTGLAMRGSALLPLTDLLRLQIGATYMQKGSSGQVRGDDFYLESTMNMGYLEFPVLLRISPQLEGPLSPYVTAGPAFSFALSCGASYSISGSFTESESEECEDPEYKTFDFGANAGAGLVFTVTPSLSLVLDLMYNYGLMSTIGDDEMVPDPKNRTFAIMVGVAFPIR